MKLSTTLRALTFLAAGLATNACVKKTRGSLTKQVLGCGAIVLVTDSVLYGITLLEERETIAANYSVVSPDVKSI